MTLGQLARAIGAELDGDAGVTVRGVCAPDAVQPGCVVYLEKTRDANMFQGIVPAAIICAPGADLPGFNLLQCKNPKLGFARALQTLYPAVRPAAGIHAAASVHPDALVAPDASVGACSVVERGARIGAGAILHPCVYVGENTVIGANCELHPRVAVLRDCELGDRVILHSGVVVGADGFGYVTHDGEHVKIPQTGRVVIEDDVEIGANSAVDRATMGETRIGRGAKIDNLVQVAHNCRIGRGVILCGQVGLSGSCAIGDYAVLAGQAGVADHKSIGSRAIIGGKAGVTGDVPDGAFYSGMPAAPYPETMRMYSLIKRLPKMAAEIKMLRRDIEALMKKNTETD